MGITAALQFLPCESRLYQINSQCLTIFQQIFVLSCRFKMIIGPFVRNLFFVLRLITHITHIIPPTGSSFPASFPKSPNVSVHQQGKGIGLVIFSFIQCFHSLCGFTFVLCFGVIHMKR